MTAAAHHPVRALVPRPIRKAALRLAGTVVGADTDEHVVGLTFDDGPDPVESDRLLAALDRAGARATFFLLAHRAEMHADVVARISAAGHEIGLHGDDHLQLGEAPLREVVRVILGGKRRLESVLGAPVTLFRPPGGEQTPLSFLLARATGMRVVHWSAAAEDWLDLGLDELVRRGLSGLGPGGILLLHERFEPDPRAPSAAPDVDRVELLERLLAAMGGSGWRAMPAGELLQGRRPRHAIWFS